MSSRFPLSRIEGLPIIVVFLTLVGCFIVASPEVFLSAPIYMSFLTTVPPVLVLALGLTFVIAAGEIDTDGYRYIKGSTSACGEVLGASEAGVVVKDWSGRRVLIVRDYTPDPPIVLTDSERDGMRQFHYGSIRNQQGQEADVGTSAQNQLR